MDHENSSPHLLIGRRGKGDVDQVLIVSAFEEPGLKLPLIDRYLISAEMGGVRPVIVLNKADLVNLALYQWIIGLYAQLGYETVVTSVARMSAWLGNSMPLARRSGPT